MWEFFGKLWYGMLDWLGKLGDRIVRAFNATIGAFFRELTRYISDLFGGLWDLVGGLFYLLGSALDVVILVVQVLLYLVQVLLAMGGGLMRSLVRLVTFDPATITPMHNPYKTGTDLFFGMWRDLGGDTIAAILTWAFWLLLVGAVLKLFAGSTAGE